MEKKYDIFISYSRKDYLMDDEKTPDPKKIVSKILNVLDAHNISYWIDKKGLYSSVQFAAAIEEQIAEARIFLFVSTQASNESKYTLGEVFTAVNYEKPIIPFRADNSKFGKGLGIHLFPLDHIEYFKIGEEAFVKLITSINHIKAEQLYDQLIAEYKAIIAEYKVKLRAKSDEMKSLGINPPLESLSDEEALQKLKVKYEKKIAEYQAEKRELKQKILELSSTISEINRIVADSQRKMENQAIEMKNLKNELANVERERDDLNYELVNLKSQGKTLVRKKNIELGMFSFNMIYVESNNNDIKDYFMSEYLVTQALWNEVMGNNRFSNSGDLKPVHDVSWVDCHQFIEALNNITGLCFRLPTKQEWLYAARGGVFSHNYEYSGSDEIEKVAWYKQNSNGSIHDVGTKEANELGIYDMCGNVEEWCLDSVGTYGGVPLRVIMGGNYNSSAEFGCKLTSSDSATQDRCFDFIGLRLVLSA